MIMKKSISIAAIVAGLSGQSVSLASAKTNSNSNAKNASVSKPVKEKKPIETAKFCEGKD